MTRTNRSVFLATICVASAASLLPPDAEAQRRAVPRGTPTGLAPCCPAGRPSLGPPALVLPALLPAVRRFPFLSGVLLSRVLRRLLSRVLRRVLWGLGRVLWGLGSVLFPVLLGGYGPYQVPGLLGRILGRQRLRATPGDATRGGRVHRRVFRRQGGRVRRQPAAAARGSGRARAHGLSRRVLPYPREGSFPPRRDAEDRVRDAAARPGDTSEPRPTPDPNARGPAPAERPRHATVPAATLAPTPAPTRAISSHRSARSRCASSPGMPSSSWTARNGIVRRARIDSRSICRKVPTFSKYARTGSALTRARLTCGAARRSR